MKKKSKIILLIIFFVGICFTMTGCMGNNMDNIDILVTNYPNEYIIEQLYGEHAIISSIYPDGVDISNYKINNKQKKAFAESDLFIYNGLISKERELAVDLLDINPNLKIIDTAYVLETDYSPEELWLNPSSLLMMVQNVRIGLKEYIDSTVLHEEIDKRYENLKVVLSELDANYRVTVDNSNNKTIVVANPALKYLEKFGLEVYCIDDSAFEKTLNDVQKLIDDNKVSYIYTFKEESNKNVKSILENNKNISVVELDKIANLSDDDRKNKENYISIMENNLDLIKKELY